MLRRLVSTVPLQASAQCRSTTILCVRKKGKVVIMGDRQVTLGERIVAKSSARKLRRLHDDDVLVGFAGSTADAITLMEKLESKLTEYSGQLTRAAVELAKDWRTDKALRRLEASIIVCNKFETLEIDGQGNVITPEEDGIVAIGSGGTYAKAAARALIDIEGWDAEKIAERAMKIATDIDVFSNGNWDKEMLDENPPRKLATPVAPAVTPAPAAPAVAVAAAVAAEATPAPTNESGISDGEDG
jgi:ATP-dependent HslUV protease subunit HslV